MLLTFFLEGVSDLKVTLATIRQNANTYFSKHFPATNPEKQLFLFAMICCAAVLQFFPNAVAATIGLCIIASLYLVSSAAAFCNQHAGLQERIFTFVVMNILSWMPLLGLSTRALLLLPVLTAQLYSIKKYLGPLLNLKESNYFSQHAFNDIKSILSHSVLQSTCSFWGYGSSTQSGSENTAPAYS